MEDMGGKFQIGVGSRIDGWLGLVVEDGLVEVEVRSVGHPE